MLLVFFSHDPYHLPKILGKDGTVEISANPVCPL